MQDSFKTLKKLPSGKQYYALPELKIGNVKRLPVSIRIMLEALLRHCDGVRVKEDDVKDLAIIDLQLFVPDLKNYLANLN